MHTSCQDDSLEARPLISAKPPRTESFPSSKSCRVIFFCPEGRTTAHWLLVLLSGQGKRAIKGHPSDTHPRIKLSPPQSNSSKLRGHLVPKAGRSCPVHLLCFTILSNPKGSNRLNKLLQKCRYRNLMNGYATVFWSLISYLEGRSC